MLQKIHQQRYLNLEKEKLRYEVLLISVARMLNSASSDGKSVATIDGMHPEFYYQEQDVRRRTPQLEDL